MARSIPGNIGAIFITGPKKIGVSTMARLLHITLSGRKGREVESVESGDLITTFGYNLRGKIGAEVQHSIDEGLPIESELMVKILNLWLIEESQRNSGLRTVIVSGAPRTGKQAKQMVNSFERSLFVHINHSNLRELIPTVGLQGFGNTWDTYNGDLVPTIKNFSPKRVIHLDRALPLKERLFKVLASIQKNHEPLVPPQTVAVAIRRICESSDPIHRKLMEIDPPRRQELAIEA